VLASSAGLIGDAEAQAEFGSQRRKQQGEKEGDEKDKKEGHPGVNEFV
jgi:hypothetical protein